MNACEFCSWANGHRSAVAQDLLVRNSGSGLKGPNGPKQGTPPGLVEIINRLRDGFHLRGSNYVFVLLFECAASRPFWVFKS